MYINIYVYNLPELNGILDFLLFFTKASMLAEFFFALAMLWWEGLRALKIDISS